MEKRYTAILLAGLVVCIILFFVSIYLAGMAAIILVVLVMSFFIMQDSKSLPEIDVSLSDNAKTISVINRGNDIAMKIRVAIVPHNIEFEIGSLAADAKYDYPLSTMLNEGKAVATYQNKKGLKYSQTFRLSALGKSNDDLLKPVIPLFKWK
ncbi:MAG: hypothetical protein ABR887_08920 [Methanoregulaceae archaeon]|jgi:hypothetical protein